MPQKKFKSAGVLLALPLFLYASAASARPVCESASSDPDNDGFGWENNETCLVNASSSTTTTTTLSSASSNSSTTSVCESASSDSDGDGYGWESNQSCRVATAVAPAAPISSVAGSTGSASVAPAASGTSSTPPVCVSASADPDGDGYGWENNQTCLVATSSVTTGSSSSAALGAPAVPGTSSTPPVCVSASSDPDGDGFGWENNQTCLVATTAVAADVLSSSDNFSSASTGSNQIIEEKFALNTPACSDARFDPDGDGFGVENSLSCTFKNAGDAGASITDVVLVTGQSNALGAETLPYQPYDIALDSPVKRVYAYSENGWGIAGLQQIWDHGWYPRSDIATDPANNFVFHFGKNLVRRDASAVVGIIMVTAPGAGISHWDETGDFFASINTRVRAALDALPGNARVSGILWHQGETDYYANDYYSNKLKTLIDNFRAQDWLADDSVFICGETLNAPVNARLNDLNTDGDPATGCVAGSDLKSVGDDIHFDAASLRILGARYAKKYQSLRGN